MKNSCSNLSFESNSSEGFLREAEFGFPSDHCPSYSHIIKPLDRRITIAVILLLFVIRFRPVWLLLPESVLRPVVNVSNWIDVSCLLVESLLALISLYFFLKPAPKAVENGEDHPTHFITCLIYKESNETVRRLLQSLSVTKAKGRIVLVFGCQKQTEDIAGKVRIARELGLFEEILISVLERDPETMIRGACSNVFYAQQCIINYAEQCRIDLSNSIFWKFDANCIMEDDIIDEVDRRWVAMPKEERAGAIFVGAVFFQTVIDGKTIFNDNDRSIWNIGFWTWKSLEAYFFRYMATAVVSLSMEGMMHAQLTNPGMVAEDELTPWKIRSTHDKTQMVRLDSRVIKAMPVPSGLKFYYSKALRWDIGGLENVIYMIKWAFGYLDGAEKITNRPVAFIHTFRQMFQRFFWASNFYLLGVFSLFAPSVVDREWWTTDGLYIGGTAILISFFVQIYTIVTLYSNSKWIKATIKSIPGIMFGIFFVQPFMALIWQTAYYVDVFVKGGFDWPVADSKGKMHENSSPQLKAQNDESTPLMHRLKALNDETTPLIQSMRTSYV